MIKTVLLIGFLSTALLAAVAIAVYLWSSTGDVRIGLHGYIALGAGVLLTFGLGAGLMALVFYSARHGYDERGPDERSDEDATRR